ncbi:hypothetical protein NA57DRAFT_74621 [Rhizodiscina lignyota]|uniref:Uncharacterized protein n=1 Tax=Rhizodiscina lignyota TaxID=1504668 RepID=A0A9P4IJB2_9PEZI|nr:hypothetical protein NA57DRAFT_74621 [Rhizodiscina lignyota]
MPKPPPSRESTTPKKSAFRTRSNSTKSNPFDEELESVGCFPKINKEYHARTNAFYQAMVQQERKEKEMKALEKAEAKQASRNTDPLPQRASSEEPITALPERDMNASTVSMTPKKSRPSGLGLNLVPEGSASAVPTARATIEARKENSIMRMLATEVPSSPPAVSFQELPETLTYDAAKKIVDTSKDGKRSDFPKSPKKKILGMNISVPSFLTASSSSFAGAAEKPASVLMSPPKMPLPPLPAIEHHSKEKQKTAKLEQEGSFSHLPSKLQKLMGVYEPDETGDSPTLGRMGVGVGRPMVSANRTVSDGITNEWDKSARERERKGEEKLFKRSKSVRFTAEVETIPPSPPAKNTPPKLKAVPAEEPKLEAIHEKSVAVQRVPQLRNDYHDLIQKAPSVHSLHGDIQLQGSQSADMLGYGDYEKNGNGGDDDAQAPKVGDRWSEGQVQAWKQARARELKGGRVAPAFHSPSLYSVTFPSENVNKGPEKRTQPFYLHYPPSTILLPRTYQPSTETITIVKKVSQEPITPEEKTFDKTTDHTSSASRESSDKPAIMQFRNQLHAESDSNSTTSAADSIMPSGEHHSNSAPVGNEAPMQAGSNGAPNLQPMLNTAAMLGNRNSGSSGETTGFYPPDVAHYPSAMPTPLFTHNDGSNASMSPPTSEPSFTAGHPFGAGVPFPPPGFEGPPGFMSSHPPIGMFLHDGSNILTHFDVVNRHIMGVAEGLHHSQNKMHEQMVNTMQSEHDIMRKEFGDMHTRIDAVEQKMEQQVARMSAINDDLTVKTAKLIENFQAFQTDLAGRFDKMMAANMDMSNKMDGLSSRILELEKRQDEIAAHSKVESARPIYTHGPTSYGGHVQPVPLHQAHTLQYDGNRNAYNVPYNFNGAVPAHSYYAAVPMNQEQVTSTPMTPENRPRNGGENWNARHHQRTQNDRRENVGPGGQMPKGRFDANMAGGFAGFAGYDGSPTPSELSTELDDAESPVSLISARSSCTL